VESVATVNGTPHVIRSRKSVSESLATPTTTPLTGLRRKPVEVSETTTPGRRVTRRTSAAETLEELQLPVRRVTRRTSITSEDAAPTASPLMTARAKQRMSIATAPTDVTLIEESEEPPVQNDRSDSPAENTRSRVRALSHSPYNSGTDSKNTSAQEHEVNAAMVKDLKINLVDAFKEDGVAVKVVKFDQETAEDDEASKTKFAKTPKTVKNMSYTNNTTIEVSKLMNSTSEIEMSQKGDSSTASVDLDKSLENLAQAIQQKGLPVAEESIMSSVQSPKVDKKDVCPATPGPTGVAHLRISSSTPIVKAMSGTPKKAVTPVAEQPEIIAAAANEEKEASPKKRNHNATFAGKSSPKKQASDTANRSWSHSVRGSSDKKIDAFGATSESPTKPVTVVSAKKFETPQKGKRKSAPRLVSSDEEDAEQSNNFEEDQCEEAPDDYLSGDSMDTSERDEMEKNEIVDDGESVDSDDSIGAGDADFDEYERDSFLASDEEGHSDELLDGSGDDLSMGTDTKTSPKKKRNSRKMEASDEEMDSSNTSSEVQKKSPNKKGGRIMKNPVNDSSEEEGDEAEKELEDNELEIVKRFQDTVSDLADKSKKSFTAQEEGAKASPQKQAKPVEGTVSPVKSPRKSLKGPEEASKNDQSMDGEKSPKKAVNTEDTTDKQKDAKSPPKSASKPQKSTKPEEEPSSDDAGASDDQDSDEGGEDDGDDEDGSGEETSDDDYDDMVEDIEDIEESDEEPKQKKKQQKPKGNESEAKPTNMFGIKEQRLHVLLQKCHEFVGIKKDELEEAKKLTRSARVSTMGELT
jgi:hypothetical protein